MKPRLPPTFETTASFTPGPWHLCHHLQSAEKDASCPCGYRGGIWGGDGEHIVCEMGSQPTPGQEGMEPPRYPRNIELANARLIAAAPELLEALRNFTDARDIAYTDALVIARDAIAKARGGAL